MEDKRSLKRRRRSISIELEDSYKWRYSGTKERIEISLVESASPVRLRSMDVCVLHIVSPAGFISTPPRMVRAFQTRSNVHIMLEQQHRTDIYGESILNQYSDGYDAELIRKRRYIYSRPSRIQLLSY